MKKILSVVLLLLAYTSTQAQYTVQGVIEYERKGNLHRQIDDWMDGSKDGENSWVQAMKSRIPKFMSAYFNYYFKDGQSLYKPGREVENPFKGMFGQTPAADNIVHTDFKQNKVNALKNVYEGKYLIQDSIRKIQWKIQEDIRMIAGYKCRKAVGKMFDSVVVVAFYTDDIMVNGGPEMFAGLPGLILEIAIPRMYTTWIATKVQLEAPKPEDLTPPSKGKAITQKELQENLSKSMKEWKSAGQRMVWWVMI